MGLNTIAGDVFITGTITAASNIPSAGSVGDSQVVAAAGISASKLQQQVRRIYAQASASDWATGRQVIHRVQGLTGTIVDIRIGTVTAAGAASTATVDVKKNGSTVLSGTVSMDNTVTAYATKQPAGYTSTSLVQGDVLEVHVTAVSGGALGKGLFVDITIREDAQ